MSDAWIDELERDLGLAARLRLLANCGGQRRAIPMPAHAERSRLASEVGAAVAIWLAARFAGSELDIPSHRGQVARDMASALRAAVIEAGLTEPQRSANAIASEHGVTSMWVRKLRAELRAEQRAERQMPLPLFDRLTRD